MSSPIVELLFWLATELSNGAAAPTGRPHGPRGHEVPGANRVQPQLRDPHAGGQHAGVHRPQRAAGGHRQGAAGGGEPPLVILCRWDF